MPIGQGTELDCQSPTRGLTTLPRSHAELYEPSILLQTQSRYCL